MKRQARQRRDLLMALESLSGSPQPEIARRHGVCTMTVRRAIQRARSSDEEALARTLPRLSELSLQMDKAIEDLALDRMGSKNARTRTAATREQMKLMIEQLKIQQFLGGPALELWQAQRKAVARKLHERLLAAAREDGLGGDMEAWLESTIRGFEAQSDSFTH